MESQLTNFTSSIRMYINLIESSENFIEKIRHTKKYFELIINNFDLIINNSQFERFIKVNVEKTKEIRQSIYNRIDINYNLPIIPVYMEEYTKILDLLSEFEKLATPFGHTFEQPNILEIDIN